MIEEARDVLDGRRGAPRGRGLEEWDGQARDRRHWRYISLVLLSMHGEQHEQHEEDEEHEEEDEEQERVSRHLHSAEDLARLSLPCRCV